MHREVVGIKRRERTASEGGGERDQKRKSNLPTPQPHFYSNMRVKRCHSCFQPSLFFSLPLLSFASRFAPSITYSLSLLSTLIVPCLISSPASPTVSITAEQQGEGKIIILKKKGGSPLGAASRTQLQLKDKSILKQTERLRVTRLSFPGLFCHRGAFSLF